jgi:hypothetical protein
VKTPLLSRARLRSACVPVIAMVAVLPTGALAGYPAAGAAAGNATWTLFEDRVPENIADPDEKAVELGMRFRSAVDGEIRGIRFYKSTENIGPHVGHLWSASGDELAAAAFGDETASGWQSVMLAAPVPVKAGATYVVSYFAPHGRYAGDTGFFSQPTRNGPLEAPADQDGEHTSTYRYGSPGFPTDTWREANYWVDVRFAGPTDPTTTPPTTPSTTIVPPAPPSAGWPDASNTGVPAGVTLTPSDGATVTTPNAVLDALDITGSIDIEAPNVTIKRSRFTGTGGTFAVNVRSGNVRIEDCEFHGNYDAAAIAYDNWTMVRSEITGMPADGVKLGNHVLFQDNWVHDFDTTAGNHADGGQVQNGVVDTVVRHNNIALTDNQNAALFIGPQLGPSTDGPLTIEDNLLAGGNYTLYVVDGNFGQYFIGNITVRNNVFVRNARYGPVTTNVPVTASGNVFADNGATVGL